MADRYLLESGAPDGYLLEDGTGVLLLEVPATPVDDGEGWWSGAAMSFAAVAVAGAAALLSTNVAVARTFIHQDEIPAAAATPASEASAVVPTQRARVSPVFHQWYAQDELPPQAAAPIVEEVYDWKPLVPTAPAWIGVQPVTANDDIVPAAAPAVALEQSDFTVDVGPAAPSNVMVWAEDDQIVPQPPFRPEESEAPLFVTLQPKIQGVLPIFDSDWTPAAPPEESEAPSLLTAIARAFTPLLLGDDDLVQFVAPTFPPEETDAPVFTAALVKPNVPLLLGVTDEWIQFVAPPVALDHSDFTVDVGPAAPSNVMVWAEDDQIVPTPTFGLEEFESPLFVPALAKANVPLWFGDDERITFVAPTPAFEDDAWVILKAVPVDRSPYFALLFQGSTEDGSTVVTEPPAPPTGTHTWLLVKRRTRR